MIHDNELYLPGMTHVPIGGYHILLSIHVTTASLRR